MLTLATSILLLAANTTDVPQKTQSPRLEETATEDELQVFETEDLALDDSSINEVDQELVEIEE
jgi:hypothetical protein